MSIITYDTDAGTITVDDIDPIEVKSPDEGLQVIAAAIGEITAEPGAEGEETPDMDEEEAMGNAYDQKETKGKMNSQNGEKNSPAYTGGY